MLVMQHVQGAVFVKNDKNIVISGQKYRDALVINIANGEVERTLPLGTAVQIGKYKKGKKAILMV